MQTWPFLLQTVSISTLVMSVSGYQTYYINCSLLNMFWNFNWNKSPGIKWTWLSFFFFIYLFFQILYTPWQKCLAKAPGVLWLLPPLNNKAMKSCGGTKVHERRSGVAATLPAPELHCVRLIISNGILTDNERPRNRNRWVRVYVSPCALCFAPQLNSYSQKSDSFKV